VQPENEQFCTVLPEIPLSHWDLLVSEASSRRSRWGVLRGWPVTSSHGSPGLAPQVGH
jgi:hypothetical protein